MTPAAEYKLDVSGKIHASDTISTSSDARFKTDIRPLESTLSKLEQLHAISYEKSKLALSMGGSRGPRQIGLLGQELEKVFPELVDKSGPEEYRSVDYSKLSVVLLEALKEQQAQVRDLQTEQKKADKRIQELEEGRQKAKP